MQIGGSSQRIEVNYFNCEQVGHLKSGCPYLYLGGTFGQGIVAQQGQGNRSRGRLKVVPHLLCQTRYLVVGFSILFLGEAE